MFKAKYTVVFVALLLLVAQAAVAQKGDDKKKSSGSSGSSSSKSSSSSSSGKSSQSSGSGSHSGSSGSSSQNDQSKHSKPPTQKTDPPAHHTDPPARHTDPPARHTDPPAHQTKPPTQRNDPPSHQTNPPARHTDPPVRHTDPPVRHTDPPVRHTDPPVRHNEPPVRTGAPPKEYHGHALAPRTTTKIVIGHVQPRTVIITERTPGIRHEYHPVFVDHRHSYNHYVIVPGPRVIYSPCYYYGHLPGYVNLETVIVLAAYQRIVRENEWREYRHREAVDSLVDRFKGVFLDGNTDSLARIIKSGKVAVLMDGEYRYSLNATDMADMLNDMVKETHTESYDIDDVRESGRRIRIQATHRFRDANDEVQTVHHEYVIDDSPYNGFRLVEFGTSR